MNISYLRDGVHFSKTPGKYYNTETRYNGETYDVKVYEMINGVRKRKYLLMDDFLKNEGYTNNVWIGRAYEVHGLIVFTEEPVLINYEGSGFNYGSCNIIEVKEPGYITVLAEND